MPTTAQMMGRLGLPLGSAEMAGREWDAIVVGAGHNGLTAAAYLARAGRRVLVLERRERVGGACTLEDPWEAGYAMSPCAYVVGLLHETVVAELELARHGYEVILTDPTFFVPFEDGESFTEWDDGERTIAEVRRLCPADVDGYRAADALYGRVRDALRPPGARDLWLGDPPPRELIEQRVGHDPDALGLLFSDSADGFLHRYFSDQRLVDAQAGSGIIGTFASPKDPGTASVAFHHASGRLGGRPGTWGYVRGGMGMISFALCDAALEAGATVATGVPVAAIRPGEGVELEDGTLLRAPVVVSNADPTVTVRLLGDAAPAGFRQRVAEVPCESPVVKVNFGLSGLPVFAATSKPAAGTMADVTRGVEHMHESFLAARRGDVSDEIWCELYFQTGYDASIAPQGRHTLSAFCQYVPYAFADGTWDTRREGVGDAVVRSIERFAPGFAELVVERDVLGPPDVERRIGLTGGHIFQGECLPEYMWDRRFGARTGVDGVYLCGAGTHPGGSVIAANGRNAAMAVLTDAGDRTPTAVS